jgi:hypothetical protein
MIIGDKNSFAIKFEVLNSIYGKIVVYVNGFEIGYYDEEVNLKTVLFQISRLLEFKDLQEFNSSKLNIVKTFNKLNNSIDEKYDATILSLGESFDDFEIRALKVDEKITIIWRLTESPFYEYKFNSQEILFGEINIKDIERVCSEVIKEIDLRFPR